MSAQGIGARVKRVEDPRFLTGRGNQYVDDINRPGQTYAWILRSPHAHAKIKSIDASAAKGMSGRGRDLPAARTWSAAAFPAAGRCTTRTAAR